MPSLPNIATERFRPVSPGGSKKSYKKRGKIKGIYANCGAWVDNVEPTYIAYYKDRIELKEALTHKVIKQLPLK